MFDKYLKIEFRKQMLIFAFFVSVLLVHLHFDPFSLIYYIIDFDSKLFFYLFFGDNFIGKKIMAPFKLDLIFFNTILFSIVFIYVFKKPYKMIEEYFLSNKETTKYMRGARKLTEDELSKVLKKDFKFSFRDNIDRFFIYLNYKKSIFLPLSFENRSILIIGSPGSGKSVLLKNLIVQIITRKIPKQKVIIYDRKPEFVQHFKTKNSLIFYPKDKNTIKWDFGNEIKGREDIRFMVDALIPLREDEKQPIFPKAARLIFESILLHLFEKDNCSNKGLIDFLREFGTASSLKLELQPTLNKYAINLEPFLQSEGQFTASVLAVFLVDLQSSFIIEEFYFEEDEANFSIKEYLLNDKDNRTLFIINPSDTSNFYGPFYTLFMSFLSRHIRSLSNDTARRIWMLLDEFQTLKTLNNRGLSSILSLLEEGRQKGASLVLATQSLNQVVEIYKKTGLSTIFNTTTTKIFLNNQEPDEQQYISKFAGTEEVSEFNTSKSLKDNEFNSLTRSVKEKKVIIPSELASLKIIENSDGSKDFECFLKLGHYPTTKINYRTQEFKTNYEIQKIEIKRGFKELEKKTNFEQNLEKQENKKNNSDTVDYSIIEM
jgi:energy-coupling factor transporter ATP-binding protein EcfA2